MFYTFFNKNIKLFEFKYNIEKESIEEIVTIFNKEYLPLKMVDFKDKNDLLKKFCNWLNIRYSKNSSWYKRGEWQYGEARVDKSFIIKSYGLSLYDQYFIKPTFSKERWENINFFKNDFKYNPFILNNLERSYDYKDVDVLYSPNITTGGELDKSWAIENGKRVLYKSSNTFLGLEPINEFIATKICEIIDLSHVQYDLKIVSNLDKKTLVSACETFITPDTELIYAEDLIDYKLDTKEAFSKYIDTLNGLGIVNAKEKIQKMLFLDMVLSNNDRHKQNYGVIRDVNSLKYLDVAPIYDTGRSMGTTYPSLDKCEENYCLFNKTNAKRKECLELLKGLVLSRECITKLKDVPKFYIDKVNEYFMFTNLREKYKNDELEDLYQFFMSNLEETLKYIEIGE